MSPPSRSLISSFLLSFRNGSFPSLPPLVPLLPLRLMRSAFSACVPPHLVTVVLMTASPPLPASSPGALVSDTSGRRLGASSPALRVRCVFADDVIG